MSFDAYKNLLTKMPTTIQNAQLLPVVEENLLVVIGRLDEAKVVFQRGNESLQPLGVGDGAVEDLDGDGALLASPLHFVDGELHLEYNRADSTKVKYTLPSGLHEIMIMCYGANI